MLWIPKRKSLPELLDLPHDSYARDELEGALKDLTLVNYCLGNGRAVLKHLAAMNAETADKGFTALDVSPPKNFPRLPQGTGLPFSGCPKNLSGSSSSMEG